MNKSSPQPASKAEGAEFRILGRRPGNEEPIRFTYNGVTFDPESFHVVAGLNAVDTREYVDQTFRALAAAGQATARMGAYKPRTSPYDFQGHGKECLPYVFELAVKHGIRVTAMEITWMPYFPASSNTYGRHCLP